MFKTNVEKKMRVKPSESSLKQTENRGFTLIEVMVALAIIAIALSAVSRSLGLTVSNQSHLESRVIATWLAENAIVEHQVLNNQQEKKISESMLNREWEIEFATEATFIPEIYKLSVAVSEKGSDDVSANLFSVVGP